MEERPAGAQVRPLTARVARSQLIRVAACIARLALAGGRALELPIHVQTLGPAAVRHHHLVRMAVVPGTGRHVARDCSVPEQVLVQGTRAVHVERRHVSAWCRRRLLAVGLAQDHAGRRGLEPRLEGQRVVRRRARGRVGSERRCRQLHKAAGPVEVHRLVGVSADQARGPEADAAAPACLRPVPALVAQHRRRPTTGLARQ